MPLFNPKTVAAALAALSREPTESERSFAAKWAAWAQEAFGGQNESQLEPEFNAMLLQGVLGYAAQGPSSPGTLKAKQPVGPGIVDIAGRPEVSAGVRLAFGNA